MNLFQKIHAIIKATEIDMAKSREINYEKIENRIIAIVIEHLKEKGE